MFFFLTFLFSIVEFIREGRYITYEKGNNINKNRNFSRMKKEKFIFYGSEDFSLQIVPTVLESPVPLHSHDFTEIVIFQKGSAIHTLYSGTEKSTYCLMQGDCFSILPREQHSYENGEGACFSNLIFSKRIISNEMKELRELSSYHTFFGERVPGKRPHIRLNAMERKEVEKLLESLTRVMVYRRPGYRLESKNILLQILLILLRKEPITAQSIQNNTPVSKKLLDTIKNIENNPEEPHSVKDLASNAGMCISGFTKKFHSLTGLAPSEYILSLRLQKATDQLYTSELSLDEIARQCGFYDANYLIKAFKRKYGVTPGKFRIKYKQSIPVRPRFSWDPPFEETQENKS